MLIRIKKVNAGALQYVLVVAIIVLIILFAFIQLISIQQKVNAKNTLYKKAILNTYNGFNYLSGKEVAYNTEVNLQFSENDNEETILFKKKWGLFDVVMVTSNINKESAQKIGLVGGKIKDKKAMYLVDNNAPLILVGNTTIVGIAYLPKMGVNSGYIGGHSFYKSTLINGKIRKSTNNLPESNKIRDIDNQFNDILINSEDIDLSIGMNLFQSFNKKTLVYEDVNTIRLEELSLRGNIVIKSYSKIIVTKESILEDVILIAPEIEIKQGVKGNFQAYATKKIQVDSKVNLTYPTFLVLQHNDKELKEEEGIFINEKSSIKGGVFFLKKKFKGYNYFPQLKINKNVEVTGEVYCSGNTELLGNVIGTVYTNNFITKQLGSVYINYIYNGNINASDLPEEYVGVGMDSKENSVLKWLY